MQSGSPAALSKREERVAGRRWACHPVIGFDDPLDRRGCLGDLCRRSGRLAEPEAI